MYKALQELDETAFWQQMIFFGVIVSINLLNALIIYYIKNRFNIHWREWLNQHFLDRWLSNQTFYKHNSATTNWITRINVFNRILLLILRTLSI